MSGFTIKLLNITTLIHGTFSLVNKQQPYNLTIVETLYTLKAIEGTKILFHGPNFSLFSRFPES